MNSFWHGDEDEGENEEAGYTGPTLESTPTVVFGDETTDDGGEGDA